MTQGCEYLEIDNDNTFDDWQPCPDLPINIKISQGQMLAVPETGDLILIGGVDLNADNDQLDLIFRLSDIHDQWIVQSKGLAAKRQDHISMFVPDSHLNCFNSGGMRNHKFSFTESKWPKLRYMYQVIVWVNTCP